MEQETKGVTRHARRKEGEESFKNWLHGKRKSEEHNMKFSKLQIPVPTSKEKKICTTPSARALSVPSSHRKMVSEVVAS